MTSSSYSPSDYASFPKDMSSFSDPNLRTGNRLLSEHTDRIEIRNLCVEAAVGHTIFREAKVQPVQISVHIPIPKSISSAAQDDSVNRGTVHYGLLSKAIRHNLQANASEATSVAQFALYVARITYGAILDAEMDPETFEVVVFLPKASAWGAGIRYHLWSGPGQVLGRILHLENLRVHTIIGVNPPERNVRQPVVANVWIDHLTVSDVADCYDEVEQIVVKTIEESSFQTLEALSEAVISNLFKLFIFPVAPGSVVRVNVEKPLAVLMAETPAVEISRESKVESEFARRAWDECGQVCLKRIPMPFPVEGKLKNYLSPAGQNGTRE